MRNSRRLEVVRAVHAAYQAAGAELLQTNSFGGNRFRLAGVGLGDRVTEINAAAVRLAREAGGSDPPLIAGTMGPWLAWRALMASAGRLAADPSLFAPEEAFAEQAAALAAAGVDLFLIETMMDLTEALAALKAARAHAPLPVVVTMACGRDGRTAASGEPAEVAALLAEAGATAVGANCGAPSQLRSALPDLPLIAQPSAGLPRLTDGQPLYDLNPRAMGAWARRLVEAGANLVGS